MPLIFERLLIWRDERNAGAAENMAADEALLRFGPDLPVLRIYDWGEPAISIGYFQKVPDAAVKVVRRWTGGGLVDHRVDRTYSLVVPRREPFARERAQESYVCVHQALSRAFGKYGLETSLAPELRDAGGPGCFAGGWAAGDLLAAGRKIAGAAQRRSRFGLLHQGSIQRDAFRPDDSPPDGFWDVFAEVLSERVERFEPGAGFLAGEKTLAQERYASRDWLLGTGSDSIKR